jgi:hypothetical protein
LHGKNYSRHPEAKLELTKCFYYILSWKLNSIGDVVPTMIEDQRMESPQITILDHSTNSEITIQQKEINEDHQTLGCKKTMVYSNVGQKEKLKKRSYKMGIKVKNSKQGWMSLIGSFIPSIKYSLPAMRLTRDDINEIQKFTIDKFLSKLGYDHSMHRAIVL